MMGGEFCVNATRAFAVELLREGRLAPEGEGVFSGVVSVSGMPEQLRVKVRPLAVNRFESAALLDLPAEPPLEEVGEGIRLVRVPGIAHLVLDAHVHALPGDKDRDTAALFARYGLLAEEAAGCIWLRRDAEGWRITPYVWVRETGTTYAETACGSGTRRPPWCAGPCTAAPVPSRSGSPAASPSPLSPPPPRAAAGPRGWKARYVSSRAGRSLRKVWMGLSPHKSACRKAACVQRTALQGKGHLGGAPASPCLLFKTSAFTGGILRMREPNGVCALQGDGARF
ncbi:MAG: hypothetical protein V8Q84_09470 [Bilophila sp.]